VREFIPDAITSRSYGSNEVAVMAGCEFAYRECFQTFLELWRKLARLRGLSALINVIDIVEDNGTAYAVSEHFEGASLRDFLLASKTGYIGWERARQLLMPVLSTLGTLHSSGIIHRGISPSTLIIGKDGKLRIAVQHLAGPHGQGRPERTTVPRLCGD
jgi:serine/threonine-protein kinase